MYTTDFEKLRALRAPMLETQQGSESVAAGINTVLALMERNKKLSDEAKKYKEKIFSYKLNPAADNSWLKTVADQAAEFDAQLKNPTSRTHINVDDVAAALGELKRIMQYSNMPTSIHSQKEVINKLITKHDELTEVLLKRRAAKKNIAGTPDEYELTKTKMDLTRYLGRLDKFYEYAYSIISVQTAPNGTARYNYITPKEVTEVEKLSDEIKMLLKKSRETSLGGIGNALGGMSGHSNYVVNLSYKTSSEIVADCPTPNGNTWIITLVDIVDDIMAKIEYACRNPQDRWVFQNIVPKDQIRNNETKTTLVDIHMFFHKYAWRLAILLPIFYTRNWRQIINGSADAQTNLLRVVDEDVIKNGLRGNHAFPSTHEVISQAFNHGVVYHDVIANSPTIQRLRISGTINSVAPYDVMNYNIARIASDFNCKVPLHDLIQNNPVAYMISPTGNKATFQVDDAKIDALVKQLTDDFTKPWATLENHYRIGSAMDSYICTEIINPVKNV